MLLDLLLLLAGLVILVAGADMLVRGATALATRLGVAPVIIGMTIVAFGTSTPELVVNLAAAFRADSSIGFGNVVGSNIANIGLLLGVVALASPLVVHRSIVSREVPMMLLASAAAIVLAFDALLGDAARDRLNRADGLMLLLLFCVFLYYMIGDALRQRDSDVYFAETAAVAGPRHAAAGLRSAGLVVAGLVLLVAGAEMTFRGAVGLAHGLAIPEVIIGLTIVAVGTSLPELATSFVAARRGQTDLAVGNIVGSNIFNLLFILGMSAVITPIDIPPGGWIDLLVMTGFATLLLPIARTGHTLSRVEGLLLAIGYFAYIGWLAVR